MNQEVYSREEYATKEFWDNRYKQKPTYFDWYAEFPELKQCFEIVYQTCTHHRILMLGCGNSKLSEQMYEAGYHKIVNVDISSTVIQQMKQVCAQKGYTQMQWLVMDVTDMSYFQSQSFDIVIDKGTLDALISGDNHEISYKLLRQAMRVVKKHGQFLLITYGSPQGRKKYFQNSVGLNRYDYYFSRVDLSPVSTLINLMRSNLGNKPLSAITKEPQALRKSMMQFNLIKVLRRNRRNQKKFIIWTQLIMSKKQEIVGQIIKQSQANGIDNEQISAISAVTKNKLNQEAKPVCYNPKKQSYCYVYSIQPKFAINLNQIISNNFDSQLIRNKEQPSSIYLLPKSQSVKFSLQKSILYLQHENIEYKNTIICNDAQFKERNKADLKIIIEQGEQNIIYAYCKTVIKIEILGEINQVLNQIVQIERIVGEESGIQAHPTPSNYNYLLYLQQKLYPKLSFNTFLNKYWYPTHQLKGTALNIHIFYLSFPPTISLQIIQSSIKQVLNKTSKWKQICSGQINNFSKQMITLFNYAAMTYCEEGENKILIEEFRQQKLQNNGATLQIRKGKIQFFFARILSAL